jgi:hypothetical protein
VRADVTALTLERANGSLPSRTPCWMARKAVRKVLRAGAGVPRVRVGGRTFKRWDDALYVGGYRGVEFSTRTVG